MNLFQTPRHATTPLCAVAALLLFACAPKNTYKVDIQAHRGGMGLYPEESLEAMLHAVDLGVNTLEMDLCVSRDKRVVLSHDLYFHPRYSTRPDGTSVQEGDPKQWLYTMDYSEIARYDVGLKPNPEWPEKRCIPCAKPLAGEVIAQVEAYAKEKGIAPLQYNMEIKSTPGEGEGTLWPEFRAFTDLCMATLDTLGLGERLVIQCFDVRTLNYLHEAYPGHILSYLLGGEELDGTLASLEASMAKLTFIPEWLSPHYSFVNQELMDYAHAHGMKVVTWTPDDPEEMRRLMGLKVEAIISNYPDRLIQAAESLGAR